jgi:site-specific recombinase XerD
MQASQTTLIFHRQHAGAFLTWAEGQGIARADEVTARQVRQYLAVLRDRGLTDMTAANHGSAIRTRLRFRLKEKYITEPVAFDMPRVANKRYPVLTADELKQVIAACRRPLDKAIVMLLADLGFQIWWGTIRSPE